MLFLLPFYAMLIGCSWGASHSAPTNIDVSSISYLGGGSTANVGRGVAVDDGGHIHVVGSGSYNFGHTPKSLGAGGDGFILTLDGTGQHVQAIHRIGKEVTAIKTRTVGGKRQILIAGDFGLAVYSDSFAKQIWAHDTVDCVKYHCRIDLATDGTVAVITQSDEHLWTFDAHGKQLGTKAVHAGGHHFGDVAIDPEHKTIIYGYFIQNHPHHVPVQVPCMVALDYTLAHEKWKDYCVSGDEDYETHNMADSRVQRLYFSDHDKKLYMSGYTDGGNSIFRLQPTEIQKNHGSLHGLKPVHHDVQPGYDKYTQTYGMHGAHSLTFIGRFDPQHGGLEKSSFFLARLSSGSGNSISTASLAAGKDGVVVAAQTSVASIEHRDALTVNGHKVADYGGNDAVLLAIPSGFDRRLTWNAFTKTKGKAASDEIAVNSVNGQTVAVLLAHSQEAEFYSVNAIPGTHHIPGHSTKQYAIVVAPIKS